jgi:hypothetical protein
MIFDAHLLPVLAARHLVTLAAATVRAGMQSTSRCVRLAAPPPRS